MAEICGQKFLWAQELVANEHETREEALKETVKWLKTQTTLEPLDAAKIWVILDQALWMTDRTLTQHDFCQKLANIIKELPEPLVEPFVNAFYARMLERWNNLDKYRVEKFYVLVRYFTVALIQYKREHDQLKTFPDLFRTILTSDNGAGLQTHFVDVIKDELPALIRDVQPEGNIMLKPFFETFTNEDHKIALIKRINVDIIDPFLESLGSKFFGTDLNMIIKFIRGFISLLNAAIKRPNVSTTIFELRLQVASKARNVLAMVLQDQEKSAEPPEKTTD